MAEITSDEFLKQARSLFGHAEDSTGGVRDRVQGAVAQIIEIPAHVENGTLTDAITDAMTGFGVAVGGGKVVAAYFVGAASATVSQTDNFTLSVIRRTAPSYSLTLSVATVTSTTDAWSPNGLGRAVPLTVSTTTDNITVNDKDTFSYVVAKNGAAGAGGHDFPEGKLVIEIR